MTQTFTYQQRIDALRQTKIEHTALKLKLRGYRDSDDKGDIPWMEPIPFQVKPNHPNGGAYGPRAIGENWRAWLDAHPVYIHPMSALAGAYVSPIPGLGGWRPEDRATHLAPLHQQYNLVYTGIGAGHHMAPDPKIGLDLGWGGLLQKIRRYRELNRPVPGSLMDDLYYGEEQLVLGIQDWIRRHVAKAREMAAAVETRDRVETRDCASLLEIADMNEWLIDNPPRNLREAVQFLAWFQTVDSMWSYSGALGQLDELLRPFYEADRAALGRDAPWRVSTAGGYDGTKLDDYDEQAVWYLASLLFNETHYSQIAGPTPDGCADVTSRVSFLVLEAMHRLRIPADIALRVHDKLNPDLLRTAVRYLFEDGTGVSYSLAKGLDEGYARNGIPIQLARRRVKVGCNWTALPGIEYCLQDVIRLCLTSPFLHAFDDVMAERRAGTLINSQASLDKLWERYVHHLDISVDTIKRGLDWHMEHQARNAPEMMLNLFCHGPIERGLDVSAGGVDIYNLTLDGVGLSTVADSFAAIEQRVVKEGRLTWEQLAQHLADDYAGPDGEKVRLMLKNIARFGTGNAPADRWAKRLSETYSHLVRDTRTAKGFNVLPGLFSHGCVQQLGENLGATPNGRHARAPISHNANPDPGFMLGGVSAPTAKANAVAAVQPGWGNSAPLQVDMDSHLAQEMGGLDAIESYIKTHNAMGGTLININVVSKDILLAAHADPERFPDLVRVTGYSAYFKSLSQEYRQTIVDRFMAEG